MVTEANIDTRSTYPKQPRGMQTQRLVHNTTGVHQVRERHRVVIGRLLIDGAEHVVGLGAKPRPHAGGVRATQHHPGERGRGGVVSGTDQGPDLITDLDVGQA